GVAGRKNWSGDRQSHLVVTRANRNRRPVGWQGLVYARRGEKSSGPHHLLGGQSRRMSSAALHKIYDHAKRQVRAGGSQRPHDGAGGYPRNDERQSGG